MGELLIIVIICVLVYKFLKANKQKEAEREQDMLQSVSMSNPQVAAVVDEVVEIVNSIVEIGNAIMFISSDYDGFIMAHCTWIRGRTYGVGITISESGDLRNYSVTPICRERNSDVFASMDYFAMKYRGHTSYDAERRQFEITTKATVELPQIANVQSVMNALIKEQISVRCSGIDVKGDGRFYDRKHHYV